MYVCLYVCMHASMYASMYLCVYVSMYASMYAFARVRLCLYTTTLAQSLCGYGQALQGLLMAVLLLCLVLALAQVLQGLLGLQGLLLCLVRAQVQVLEGLLDLQGLLLCLVLDLVQVLQDLQGLQGPLLCLALDLVQVLQDLQGPQGQQEPAIEGLLGLSEPLGSCSKHLAGPRHLPVRCGAPGAWRTSSWSAHLPSPRAPMLPPHALRYSSGAHAFQQHQALRCNRIGISPYPDTASRGGFPLVLQSCQGLQGLPSIQGIAVLRQW